MDQPMVTVFIPCYNAERFIAETIESILAQTYQDFEVLIIDDGSKDNSRLILSDYAAKDTRIRVLANNGNRGVAYTRNRGIKEAKGKYLATIDADDIATQDRLEKEVRYLEEHPSVGLVAGNCYIIDEHGKKTGKSQIHVSSAEDIRAHLFIKNIIFNSTTMYRLDIVRKYAIKYKNGYHGIEDYMFWCMLINRTDFAVLDDCFLYYRIVNSGLTVVNRKKCNEERNKCFVNIHRYTLRSNGFHINKRLLRYCLPRFSDTMPQNGVKDTIVISLYFIQLLLQARQMKKPYYFELRTYLFSIMKNMIKETV